MEPSPSPNSFKPAQPDTSQRTGPSTSSLETQQGRQCRSMEGTWDSLERAGESASSGSHRRTPLKSDKTGTTADALALASRFASASPEPVPATATWDLPQGTRPTGQAHSTTPAS